MSFINNNNEIVDFIKQQLGCQCPDEVFKTIELIENYHDSNSLTLELIVGNKLMVVIIRNENLAYSKQSVLNHLLKRIKERDEKNLNRVRIVFAIPDDVNALNTMNNYADMDIDDKKAHVHFINNSIIDKIYKSIADSVSI